MFDNLSIHPESREKLDRFLRHPSHAVLIEGPAHIGKHAIARQIAAALLEISPDALTVSGSYRELTLEKSTIGIEQVRELSQFFSLKSLGEKTIQRVVVIPDAELMNHPAQNALLKLLEEPPSDAVILLTSSAAHRLLPTITSRAQRLVLRKPSAEVIKSRYAGVYSDAAINQALVLGDGCIGSVHDQLTVVPDEGAVTIAEIKRILGLSLFDQLLLVETTLKDKNIAAQFIDQLAQVSAASLMQTVGNPKAAAQWRRISAATYAANQALKHNVSSKLVLTELILSLRD